MTLLRWGSIFGSRLNISARGQHICMKFGAVRGTEGLYETAKFQGDRTGNGLLANFQTSFSYLRNGRTTGLHRRPPMCSGQTVTDRRVV